MHDRKVKHASLGNLTMFENHKGQLKHSLCMPFTTLQEAI